MFGMSQTWACQLSMSHKALHICGERGRISRSCPVKVGNVIHGRRMIDGHVNKIEGDMTMVGGTFLKKVHLLRL